MGFNSNRAKYHERPNLRLYMYTYMYVKIHFLHYNVRFFIDDSYLEALTLQLASSTSKRSLRRNLGSSKGSSKESSKNESPPA